MKTFFFELVLNELGLVYRHRPELPAALDYQIAIGAGPIQVLFPEGMARRQDVVGADLVVELDGRQRVFQAVGVLAGPVLEITDHAQVQVIARGERQHLLHEGDRLLEVLALGRFHGLGGQFLGLLVRVLAAGHPDRTQHEQQSG